MNYRGQNRTLLDRERKAVGLLAEAFERAGWKVKSEPGRGRLAVSLTARRRGAGYVVSVKAGAEGRPDRLVPLFAQAVLEASREAGGGAAPLAVVAAPRITLRAAEQVLDFARGYAPRVAAGVLDFEGLRVFKGPQLEGLSAPSRETPAAAAPRQAGQLFSDLNQWLLKVLLAPELPERLLSAPRGRYRNASELARASGVSVMTAFRFVRQLRREGYLHESAAHLELVRREHLFDRWQAAAQRSVEDAPVRFVLPGDTRAQTGKLLGGGSACLALFGAADALGLGLVEGVPPYVYVRRIRAADVVAGEPLRPSAPGETPHLILREAPAPESVFRGVVRPRGLASCDVVQVWLDVAPHPARGREQAELIRRRVIERLIGGRP